MSQTLILLKPDCVQRKLVERVLEIFEKNGLKVKKKSRKFKPSKKQITLLYKRLNKKNFIKPHIEFVASGQCILAILEGKNAIAKARKLIGNANPKKASKGTIRQKFGSVSKNKVFKNIVHSADSRKEFKKELALFKKLL